MQANYADIVWGIVILGVTIPGYKILQMQKKSKKMLKLYKQ